jgi:hypothetical protein
LDWVIILDEVTMKKIVWIIMAIIATLLVMLFAAWKIYGWYFRSTNNPEPFNKNITFVGNDDRHYNYSQAMQNTGNLSRKFPSSSYHPWESLSGRK